MPKPPPSFASGPSVFELEEVAEVKLNTWCKAGCGPGSWPASTTSTTAGEVVAGNQPPQRIPRASVFTSLISEAVVSCDMETQAWSNYLNSDFFTIYLRCSLSSACSLPLFAVFSCFASVSLFPRFLFIYSLSLSFFLHAWAWGCMSIKSNKIKYMLQSLTVCCSAPSNACNFSRPNAVGGRVPAGIDWIDCSEEWLLLVDGVQLRLRVMNGPAVVGRTVTWRKVFLSSFGFGWREYLGSLDGVYLSFILNIPQMPGAIRVPRFFLIFLLMSMQVSLRALVCFSQNGPTLW